MNPELPNPHESHKAASAELYDAKTTPWSEVGETILEIEKLCMGEFTFEPTSLQKYFEDPKNVVVLLKEESKIVGFSLAMPDKGVNEGNLYICATEILPEEQGKGRVGVLIGVLEKEARTRGFKFLTRHARVANGYADNVSKHYGNRIVETHEDESDIGPRRYFKIAL